MIARTMTVQVDYERTVLYILCPLLPVPIYAGLNSEDIAPMQTRHPSKNLDVLASYNDILFFVSSSIPVERG